MCKMGIEMIIKEIQARGIITKSNLPDADYVANPYIGCGHGCIYCYADFMKRFTNHKEDWGKFIDVKVNAPDLVKKNYSHIFFSSVTDPYQPIESKYKLTRKLLEKLIDSKVEILTKSALVTRDIDVFKKFKDITIGVSISTLDDSLSRQLEPFASLPRLRLKALKKIKDAGLKTYVFVSPIIPYVTDIKEIVKESSFADYLMFENLNLRPANKTKMMEFISKNKPEVLDDFKKVDKEYWDKIEKEIKKLCKNPRIYFHHSGFKKG